MLHISPYRLGAYSALTRGHEHA